MKKLLAMLLALSMSCAVLASCGESNDESSSSTDPRDKLTSSADDSSADDGDDSSADDESSKEDDGEGDTADTLFNKLMSDIEANGAFTLGMDIYGEGMYITTDGANLYEEMNIFGIAVTMLITPDATYGIDTEGKRYYKEATETTAEEISEMLSEFTNLADMKYSSTSTDTIDGVEYTIETYTDVDEYGDEYELSFAFNDAGEMCYAYEDGEYLPYIFTATADTSKFSLDGYTEMTEEEYEEFLYSDMDFDWDFDDEDWDIDWDFDDEDWDIDWEDYE